MSEFVKLFSLIGAVLGFLLIERLTVLGMIRTEKGRQWFRAHKWASPNAICIYRIPMGVVCCLLWVWVSPELAGLLFAFFMLTDMTDGTIARGCDLGTPTGEWLDPLSDKCMYIPLLWLFALHTPEGREIPYLTVASVGTFTVIDTIGQFSRLFTKKKAANSFGKAKTTMVCTVMIFLALKLTCYDAYMQLPLLGRLNMEYAMWGCVALSFLSFYCKIVPDAWYANSLTFLNFVCGISAIYLAWEGSLMPAFIMIFVGQFFDLLDGRCARKFGSTRWGALFDDIADGTSFGIAIGVIIYRTLSAYIHIPTWVAALIGLFFAISVIFRLYRFLRNTAYSTPGLFEGLPSPAGAMLAGSGAILFELHPYLVITVVIISSTLMISKLPYKHFGQRIWGKLPNAAKLGIFITIMIFTILGLRESSVIPSPFALWVFSMIVLYVFLGVEFKKEQSPNESTVDTVDTK